MILSSNSAAIARRRLETCQTLVIEDGTTSSIVIYNTNEGHRPTPKECIIGIATNRAKVDYLLENRHRTYSGIMQKNLHLIHATCCDCVYKAQVESKP